MGKRTGNPRGRPKGAKSRFTKEREQRLEETKQRVSEALGVALFSGDAHELLMLTYKDMGLPLDTRLDAAKAAIPYEKPKLASMEANVNIATHEDSLEALADDEGEAGEC